MTLRVLGIVATLLIPAAIDAQTPAATPAKNTERLPEGAPRPAARVTDFAWLVGTLAGRGPWRGHGRSVERARRRLDGRILPPRAEREAGCSTKS